MATSREEKQRLLSHLSSLYASRLPEGPLGYPKGPEGQTLTWEEVYTDIQSPVFGGARAFLLGTKDEGNLEKIKE